jgi:SecD/SecF fusion protein
MNNLRDESRKELREAKIGFTGIGIQGAQLVIKLAKPEERDAAIKALHKVRQALGNALLGTGGYDVDVSAGPDDGTIIVKPTEQGLRARISNAAAASIETINRRVNNLGTSESTIVRQGQDRILVQFPGLKDTKELKALIGETAKLSFHEVHPSLSAEVVTARA